MCALTITATKDITSNVDTQWQFCCTDIQRGIALYVSFITSAIDTGNEGCISIAGRFKIVTTDDIDAINLISQCRTDINQGVTLNGTLVTATKDLTNPTDILLRFTIDDTFHHVDVDMGVTDHISSLTISTTKDLTDRCA